MLSAGEMPEPAKRLLVHRRDMTTTLADFHGSTLRTEKFQQCTVDDLYLREVFLRTVAADRVVEYGVIAIALEQFGPAEKEAIAAAKTPLGQLLHEFKISFTSAPIGYFSVTADALSATRFAAFSRSTLYGRFNRLAKKSGEPLAWIMEILPSA